MKKILSVFIFLSFTGLLYAGEVLELIVEYDRGDIKPISYTLTSGSADINYNGEHILSVLDNNAKEIFFTTFDIPLTIDVPPDPVTGESFQIPVNRNAAVVKIPTSSIINEIRIDSSTFKFRSMPFLTPLPAPNTEVIYGNCSGELCFDLFLVSDGYSDMSHFKTDAQTIANFFGSIEPYKSNLNLLRIVRVDNTTSLGCYNNCNGIQRLICCDSGKLFSAVSGLTYDEILVITNTNEYGGSGYIDGTNCADKSSYAVTFRDTDYYAKEVAIHETGHSFGGLWDEYEYGINGSGEGPNCVYDSTCAVWKGIAGAGCFAGCSYNGMYRPTENGCLMRTLSPAGGYKFCPVCKNRVESKLKTCFSNSCTPDCTNKECGDDGCGGNCGGCSTPPSDYCLNSTTLRDYSGLSSCVNYECNYKYTDRTCSDGCENGRCKSCIPDCTNKECGDDGCGGNCGLCNNPPADICIDLQVLRDYSPYGICNNNICNYQYTDKKCDYICEQNRCISRPTDGGTDIQTTDTDDVITYEDAISTDLSNSDIFTHTDLTSLSDLKMDTNNSSTDKEISGCSCSLID